MTAILYSEGLRDIGAGGPFDDDDDGDERAGPLRHLIQGVLGHPDGLEIECRKLGHVHGGRETHGMRGYAKKVHRAIRDAQRNGHAGIIVVIDRDGASGDRRLGNLQQGRERAREQDGERGKPSLPCALGVAQEMVESWLLGDAAAWRRAFGLDAPAPPTDPEVNTGAGGSPRCAKRMLERRLEQAGAQPNFMSYTELARHIQAEELVRSCPRSFRPFAEELRREIGPIYGMPWTPGRAAD
jgi:hypothetical protein